MDCPTPNRDCDPTPEMVKAGCDAVDHFYSGGKSDSFEGPMAEAIRAALAARPAERLALMGNKTELIGASVDLYRDAQDAVWSMSPDGRAEFFEWFV